MFGRGGASAAIDTVDEDGHSPELMALARASRDFRRRLDALEAMCYRRHHNSCKKALEEWEGSGRVVQDLAAGAPDAPQWHSVVKGHSPPCIALLPIAWQCRDIMPSIRGQHTSAKMLSEFL